MKIQQFEDKYLAHYSYAILSECERKIVLIDPSRNPKQYYDYAKEMSADIIAVVETHPHADFVSSHLEIHETTGAKIYAHSLTGVSYPFEPFDEGSEISFGKIKLRSLYTPGHSPDSISIVLNHDGKDKAVFTGDTLFIGDCGRPDLREGAGNIQQKRDDLARQMYSSLRNKLMTLNDEVLVYPAHGAGTLCGKGLSEANRSTIGAEKISNWSLQEMTEEKFIKELTADQPFIPKYFGYDVDLNRKGVPAFEPSVNAVKILTKPTADSLNPDMLIIDASPQDKFKKGHFSNSFNIQLGAKFETWLGSIVSPGEKFYLAASDQEQLNQLIERSASIGYESFIEAAIVSDEGKEEMEVADVEKFRNNPDQYSIIDIRNSSEFKSEPIFPSAKNIPLGELRERINEIPTDKPVIVHCAGGYRSAAGSSIVNEAIGDKTQVFDLGEAIEQFGKH
ncbi:MAG: MBL fold metallo-hydrolase [Daejeonella sp.]|uniref:MBL fold metallo-hydrolase n=1 Tax=unclassified Daejeonella TaxID=2805396 RepID=UPI0023ECA9E3|nr:MBL fold metallo-hydrolase [Daejeonella sp. JGW-45]